MPGTPMVSPRVCGNTGLHFPGTMPEPRAASRSNLQQERPIVTEQLSTSDANASRDSFLSLFPSIILPMFLAVLDQTIIAAALPEIAASLGHVQYISWVVVAYLVANTVAAPVYGRLGDLFGRRKLMLGALVVFSVASVLCALAPRMELLVMARLLQGVGGGGLMALTQALVGEAVPPRERARFQGYLAAVAVSANALGPVVGGYLTQHLGWQAIFLVNVPLGVVAFLLILRLKANPGIGERRPFDVRGLLFLSIFVASTLIGFSQAQDLTAGAAVQFSVLLVTAVIALVLLIRHEAKVEYPLLPIKLLRRPVIWRTDALAACHGATFVSLITFIPLYMRVVRGVTVSEIGLLVLPLSVGVGLGSLMTGRAVSRTGRTAIFPSLGLSAATATLVVLALAGDKVGTTGLSYLLGLTAVFMGTVMGVVQVTVQSAAGPHVLGAAAASVQLSRSIGAALGTGLVSLVLFAALAAHDAEIARLFHELIQRGPDMLTVLSQPVRVHLQEEVRGAFVAAFLTIAGFAAMGTALAWSIPVRRL
jgi:EmrB/QacA subfamily drug resistance transporter